MECETAQPITNSASSISGNYDVRSDSAASGGKFYFMQAGVNAWSQFTLPAVAEDGLYELYIRSKDNQDRGIMAFTLADGTAVGTVDFYANSNGVYQEHAIGQAALHAGEAISLRMTCTGKNSAAAGKYGVVADRFRLVRVGDLPPEPVQTLRLPLDGTTALTGTWSESSYTDSTGSGPSRYSNTAGIPPSIPGRHPPRAGTG